MIRRLLAPLCLAAALLLAAPAAADFISDQLNLDMRAGPGLQFKILRFLKSGDAVTRLSRDGDWSRIRTSEGKVGWVLSSFITSEPPASIVLPEVQARLEQSRSRIDELDRKLAEQTQAIAELEKLRERNEQLETENQRLSFSSTWKAMATGATIIAIGAIIGLAIPRGGGARSRLKL